MALISSSLLLIESERLISLHSPEASPASEANCLSASSKNTGSIPAVTQPVKLMLNRVSGAVSTVNRELSFSTSSFPENPLPPARYLLPEY